MSESSLDIETLYTAERRRLEAIIRRIIGCPSTAADLVHDLFVRIWDRPIRRDGDAAAYLTRSARNAAIDYLRSERMRALVVRELVVAEHCSASPSPDEILEVRQALSQIDAVIRSLPERTRHMFLLNRIHGRSYGEIAQAFGISVSAVEQHMSKALAAIRRGVEET